MLNKMKKDIFYLSDGTKERRTTTCEKINEKMKGSLKYYKFIKYNL